MSESSGPYTLVLLVVPAIALRLAVRALYGRRRLAAADPMQLLLSLSSTIMFVLAASMFLVAPITSGIGVLILFIPLLVAAVIIALMMVDRGRQAEHRALLWSLATAAQRGIPLSESARAYADETLGDTGVRAMALAQALERGQPLAVAVRTARLRMGTAMRLAVELGERLGLLAPSMKQQLDDSQQVDAALRAAIARFFYLIVLIVVLSGICTYVMLKIVPVFVRMFQEFGIKLPAITLFAIQVAEWFVEFGWMLFVPLACVLLPALTLVAVLYYVGWMPRNIPLWWRLFKRYDGALVMRGLALAVRRQMPLPQALQLVADSYPMSIIAGKVRDAAGRVEGGMDWRQSLKQVGLITQTDAAVLSAAERTGNLDWALEEMADGALRREIYRVQMLIQLLFPLAILSVGALVFVFAVGMFIPLVSLIQGLS